MGRSSWWVRGWEAEQIRLNLLVIDNKALLLFSSGLDDHVRIDGYASGLPRWYPLLQHQGILCIATMMLRTPSIAVEL